MSSGTGMVRPADHPEAQTQPWAWYHAALRAIEVRTWMRGTQPSRARAFSPLQVHAGASSCRANFRLSGRCRPVSRLNPSAIAAKV